jgi:hypothetical protein
MTRQRHVLLGQLGANGDCVYATTVARQIKADYPSCHLTWAIGAQYRQVIAHNPHVDDVWEITGVTRTNMSAAWRLFAKCAVERKRNGDFDAIYATQVYPDNYRNFDGTVRASIFRGYTGPITVPVTPVVRLTVDELDQVRHFAQANALLGAHPAIIFECSSLSGQSSITPSWALTVAKAIIDRLPRARIVLTTGPPPGSSHPGVIDGSVLGFREYAALTHYCSLLIGCSSGITWVCTSDVARPLPTIQVLARSAGVFGAVVHDLDYWGLPSDHVVELRDCTSEEAANCAFDIVVRGVSYARRRHDTSDEIHLEHYAATMFTLIEEGHVVTGCSSLRHVVGRYGARSRLWRDLAKVGASRLNRRLSRLRRIHGP